MGYYLESIHMRNFKLFSNRIIKFEKNLNILDGANGYGKTSSFDAIEYALTGSIDRIVNKSNTDGKYAFDNDCLEKVPSDGAGTSVSATLKNTDNDNELVIIRKLDKGVGKENNPSKIKERTKTTVELNNEIILEDANLLESQKKLLDILGQDLFNLYNKFYYIPQENRLSFLSKNDKDRMKEIQTLFNIEKEEANIKKINEVKQNFNNLYNELNKNILEEEEKIKNKKNEIESLNKEEKIIKYKQILKDINNEVIWDKEKINIKDKDKLFELQDEIRGIESFVNNFKEYLIEKKNNWIKNLSKDVSKLEKYLFLNIYDGNLEEFKLEKDRYNKVVQSIVYNKNDNEKLDYENIKYKPLKDILELNINIYEIEYIKNEIKNYRKKIQNEDRVKNKLLQLQKDMLSTRKNLLNMSNDYLDEKECPFCGYIWNSKSELDANIDDIHNIILESQCQNQRLLDKEVRKLEKIYMDEIKVKIDSFLNYYRYLSTDICNNIYKSWDVEKAKYELFISECTRYNIDIKDKVLDKNKIEEWLLYTQKFITDKLQSQIKPLTKEYFEQIKSHDYKEIFKKIYNDDTEKVKSISKDDIKEKISYLDQIYYLSKNTEISIIEQKVAKYKIQSTKVQMILEDIRKSEKILKEELKKHKDNIVNHLQVPFYLYSGRILQNYPGGLGIKMKNEKDNIIFEATNRPGHDVFYTLSSGQLSSIVVALTMTLSKMYAEGKFRCMLIDDPFQTMDELNISSFVELLRNDFPNYQFIFSTHEADFSDYIRYKFDKYGLTNKSILMQDETI
ncbi:AAA family ATPase [Paraclostridium sordellii]|uniref:AAA family ATPase n=1 Tax=Paraclostridium sordellii TaxID=1505 RepID=UPI0005DCA1CB|nr:AAA family ATPase [Paeniclostridium sordellii]CEN78418.1 putative RecF/RecN/SMC N domain [[Clostridium] sordellii] [Paeniclostridium sordellii]